MEERIEKMEEQKEMIEFSALRIKQQEDYIDKTKYNQFIPYYRRLELIESATRVMEYFIVRLVICVSVLAVMVIELTNHLKFMLGLIIAE